MAWKDVYYDPKTKTHLEISSTGNARLVRRGDELVMWVGLATTYADRIAQRTDPVLYVRKDGLPMDQREIEQEIMADILAGKEPEIAQGMFCEARASHFAPRPKPGEDRCWQGAGWHFEPHRHREAALKGRRSSRAFR